ncbi:MAG: hypothetical protein H7289_10455 [Mucilaginibacter sp.]|nr:hypothetical protein [Mucilaginibacter sp.]
MLFKKVFLGLLLIGSFYRGIAQTQPIKLLNAYAGTWIIFKDEAKRDTVCLTTSTWSKDHTRLLAAQIIHDDNGITRDSCFYSYDITKKTYPYYETDESGKIITVISDIIINGNTWIYNHHLKSTKLYRTLNTFNAAGDEITYQSQRSEDGGVTWTTTRNGKEYRIKK